MPSTCHTAQNLISAHAHRNCHLLDLSGARVPAHSSCGHAAGGAHCAIIAEAADAPLDASQCRFVGDVDSNLDCVHVEGPEGINLSGCMLSTLVGMACVSWAMAPQLLSWTPA
jgi:hypothetical protein